MNPTLRFLSAGLLAVLSLVLLVPHAGAEPAGDEIDVYIVYSGKEKAEKDALVAAMDKKLNVKTYNVDVLRLSDYSAKQKAVAKIEAASLVLLLGDGPVKILKGTKFKTDMIIISNGTRKVSSKGWNLNVVPKGTDVSKLPDEEKHAEVAGLDDVKGNEDLLDSEAVTVTGGAKDLDAVVAELARMKLAG